MLSKIFRVSTKYVLITTTWRSGSSLFLELVSAFRSSSFSVLEPLEILQSSRLFTNAYPSFRTKRPKDLLLKASSFLEDIFTCRFNRSGTRRLIHFWSSSNNARGSIPTRPRKDTLSGSLQQHFVKNTCENSNWKVIKVTRLIHLFGLDQSIEVIERLLQDVEDLFVVILIRDPRSVYASR